MSVLPSWEVSVKGDHVTLKRDGWSPVRLSKRQAREIKDGITKALVFLGECPLTFEPVKINESIQNKRE